MRRFVISLFLLSLSAFADDVKIEFNPPKPVAGEVFQAYVRIFTDSDQEPAINFTPAGVEVVDKSNQGISTRTTYANGQLTVTREMTFVYDLVANRVGTAHLRDFTVQLGSRVLRHPPLAITVLKEAEVLPDIFVKVDVPKTTLYVGEGVIARYYIYHKAQMNNLDVKKYPKLNNFLKRFLQEPDRSERVVVDGQMYVRSQIYAAKLFPEKSGELHIDPLHLTVTYSRMTPGDPFSAFGMSRDTKTKSLSSDNVTLQVKALPAPVPSHFTGLVGKHDFQIQFGQTKLIVNEPLEVKLTVTGGGALENLEAPGLLKHPGLEEFESNGDLKITDADQATKTFDYTFLAKENLKLPAGSLTLSYFDPSSERYVPVQLNTPEIIVAGAGAGNVNRKEEPKASEPEKKKSFELPKVSTPSDLAGPLLSGYTGFRRFLPYMNLALACGAFLFAVGWFMKTGSLTLKLSRSSVPRELRRSFSIGEFTRWVSPVIQKTGKSPMAIIKDAPIDESSRKYFLELLSANEMKDYASRKTETPFVYKAAHFKELGRYIESVKHENHT